MGQFRYLRHNEEQFLHHVMPVIEIQKEEWHSVLCGQQARVMVRSQKEMKRP